MLRNWKGMGCGAGSREASRAMARLAITGAIVTGAMLGGAGSLSPRSASAAGVGIVPPAQVLIGRGRNADASVTGIFVLQLAAKEDEKQAKDGAAKPAAANEAAAEALTEAVNDLFKSGAVAPAAADAKAAADREQKAKREAVAEKVKVEVQAAAEKAKDAANAKDADKKKPAVKKKPVDAKQEAANKAAAAALTEAVSDLFNFGVVAPAAAVANMDAMDQQFRPHVTNILNAELHFIKKLCGPTAEQYKVIKAAGKEEANAVIRKLAQFQAQNNNRGIPNWPSPRKLLSDKFATLLETAQSPEAAEKYRREVALREESRKLATVHNMSACLDRKLALTPEQIDKLDGVLIQKFEDKWMQQMMVYVYPEEYHPRPAEALVLPILTEAQRKAWKALPPAHMISFGWEGEANFFGEMVGFEEQ